MIKMSADAVKESVDATMSQDEMVPMDDRIQEIGW
jgi:hypothetical protein